MSFETLNIDVALQISNKILFEKFFGYALTLSVLQLSRISVTVISKMAPLKQYWVLELLAYINENLSVN